MSIVARPSERGREHGGWGFMVSKSGRLLAVCASLLMVFGACDEAHKSGGKLEEDSGVPGGDGDNPGGDGDGGGPEMDGGGCVYCDGGPDGAVVDLPAGSVGGFVFSTANPPVPLANIRIVGPGDHATTTNADGFFVLNDVAPGDGVLRAESKEHTHALRPITVRDDASLYVELFLKQVYKTSFDPSKGGVAKDKDSGASVAFPAGSLKRNDGSSPKGEAKVSVVAVSEGKAKAGTTTGTAKDNTKGVLKGYTPVEVRVEDEDGERLQISSDKEVEVEFPISGKAADSPSTIKLWSMDEKDGTWKQEDSEGEKGRNGQGQSVYKAKIKHLSWWSADDLIPADNVTCVRGCVKQSDAAMAANSASVEISAVKSPFFTVLSTDGEGCFYVELEASSEFTVSASGEFGSSSVLSFTSGSEAKTIAAGKDACADLGNLQLVAPQNGAPRCPAGYELCDDKCVDIRNDSTQCGTSCGALVNCGDESAGPEGSACFDGTCTCPPGFTLYWNTDSYRCIDFKNDPSYCGSPQGWSYCQTEYTLDTCVDGECIPLVCKTGTPCRVYDSASYRDVAACVDTQNDPVNCGGCGYEFQCDQHANEGDPDPNMTCTQGQCGCGAGTLLCKPYVESEDIACVDPLIDGDNCGGCGQNQGAPTPQHQCDYATQACSAGACTAKTCPAGQTLCDGECFDLQNDPYHCGSCSGSECSPSQVCNAGVCSCAAGQLTCATPFYPYTPYCAEQLDNSNCGSCNTQCNADTKCTEVAAGEFSCEALNCGAGTASCSAHECIDLSKDANNCGGCGIECKWGSCQAGSCACPASQKVCPTGSGSVCVDKSVECNFVQLQQL